MTPAQYAAATVLVHEIAALRADLDAWTAVGVPVRSEIEIKIGNRTMPDPPPVVFNSFKLAVIARLESRLTTANAALTAL